MLTDLEKTAISDHYKAIAQNLPNFRPRTAQREMLAAIANTFSRSKTRSSEDDEVERNGESIAVIEGPTGVGKSLAYLLAGGIMAQTRNKKLVVTSATIALQEQLVNRDLPFVVEKSGLELTFALAKGRGRYLCPYRLYQLTNTHAQTSLGLDESVALWDHKPKQSELDTLNALADGFTQRSFNGDRDTWPQNIDDGLWQRVTNDRHGCLKQSCPNRPECPFYLARDVLETVDVVVANHDLLLADISMGGGVILPAPENAFYCIDEAHHLAKKAVNQFAAEHSLGQAQTFLERLPALTGNVAALANKAEVANLADEAASALLEHFGDWMWQVQQADQLAPNSAGSDPLWLWDKGLIPEGLEVVVENTAITARMLLKHLYNLNDALATERRSKDSDTHAIDTTSSELGMAVAMAEKINAVWDLMATTPREKEPPLAKWIVAKRQSKIDFVFCASPVSSATLLASRLWRRAAGALLTSATLQSLGSFDLLLRQTGLQWLPDTTTLALESPFDFGSQGELYLPRLPVSPKDANGHTLMVAEWLPQLIDLRQGIGTLVLFSSRKQMQEVAMRLPTEYLDALLVQGDMPKAVLLAQHLQRIQNNLASVIFGLDSFAEGLDLPGFACMHVVIAKLPFSMPDNPIDKTLSDWISDQGGNPFMEITVPEASIKLIQAVGRLIRTESDMGRITILDSRLTSASYGKKMLAALPPFKRI